MYQPEMMALQATSVVAEGWELRRRICQDKNFEEWVEIEMEKFDVTMEVGPKQVLVREQENVA